MTREYAMVSSVLQAVEVLEYEGIQLPSFFINLQIGLTLP